MESKKTYIIDTITVMVDIEAGTVRPTTTEAAMALGVGYSPDTTSQQERMEALRGEVRETIEGDVPADFSWEWVGEDGGRVDVVGRSWGR